MRFGRFLSIAIAVLNGFLWAVAAAPALADVPGQELSRPLSAQEREQARVHFQMGVNFYKDHDFRAALIEFRRAYDIAPHHTVLFNLAQASLELKEYVMALEYLDEYLQRAGDKITRARHDDVLAMMEDLVARTAMVEVQASPEAVGAEIRLDGEPVGTVPMHKAIRVGAGRRQFSMVLDGRELGRRTVDVAAGDKMRVTLDAAEPLRPQQTIVQVTQQDGGVDAAVWAGIATGVLAAGAGTMTFVTMSKADEYEDLRTGDTLVSADKLGKVRNAAKRYAWITDGLYAGTLVSALVTAVLYLSQDKEEEPSKTPLQLGVGPQQVTLSGQF